MRTPRAVVAGALAQAHRHDWASVLAATARTTRDLDLAQESVQEAYAQAMEAWARDGVPHNPAAWLTVTARRRATDVVRRQASLRGKLPLLVVPDGDDPPGPDLLPGDLAPVLHDDRLRLIFMCCHPALDDAARAALTLRLVLGVPTADVAALFLVPTATMAARITRAKRKIARAHIPFAVPRREQLPERLPAVLDVTYLLGTLGHAATSGERRQQGELLDRAVELATLLRRHVPHDPELLGLGALLELLRARAATATDDDGTPVPLSGQDRSRWDRDAIDRAHRTVVGCLRAGASGPYLLQAAIAAVHATAPSHAATDWTELVTLYDALLARQPSPVVALNRAVAVSMAQGPEAGLALVDALASEPALRGYAYLPAARAEMLARLGRHAEAARAYGLAADLARTDAERRVLRARAETPENDRGA
ncbi:RNA polymerase sigma factor [Barrientosiimonas humi]|uniref:RNA polymerase sigma factor n=1 Tax=Barrientosiimonas humi TaxID=999931 RepID=UPI00370D3A41